METTPRETTPLTMRRAIELFEVSLRADGRSPLTVISYIRDLKQLERFLVDRFNCIEVVSITRDMVNEFIVSPVVTHLKNEKPKTEGSINKMKASVKSFFNWLHGSERIPSNPAGKLRIRHIERPAPNILTDVEKKSFLKAIANTRGKKAFRDFAIMSLFLNTGIRVSELLGLDIEDVNLPEKRITIKTKGGHLATRFLNTKIRRILDSYLRSRKRMVVETRALFISNQGARLSSRQVQRCFKGWLAVAGIEKNITVHGMRHTFASNLLEKTGNLALVQKSLGHRNIATTTIYAHVPSEALQDALESL